VGKASRHKREHAVTAAAPPEETSAPAPRKQTALICAGLIVLVLAVFGRTAWNGFIEFDDPDYVSQNPVIQRGLTAEGVKYAFTAVKPYYWEPLTWLSHELDVTVFGVRPGAHHLVSVLLHGLTAALLYLFLLRATGPQWAAAAAAALWAVHPLRVESVAWVAERKDILAGLFFVATLLAYVRGRQLLVWLMFALALMSKPTVVTAPLVFVVLDEWPLRRRNVIRALAPLVLAIPIAIVTLIGQQRGIADIALSLRLMNAVRSAGAYLGKLLLPVDLAIIYPFRDDIALQAAFSAVVLAAITFAAWHFRRTRPYLATGWGWYLAMLIPVIGLVQSGAQAMADRFTYIPSMGLALAAVWFVAEWPAVRKPAFAVALLAFSAVSVWYAGLWRDTVTLFTHATAVTRENSLAHVILGNVYLAEKRFDDATNEYAKAVQAGRGATVPLAAYGSALVQQKRFVEAVEPLQRVVDAEPRNESARENLAAALIRSGRPAAALPHLEQALKLDPARSFEIIASRGEAKLALGQIDDALKDFQQVANARPSAAAWNDLARAHASRNDFANAERAYREAVRLDPDNYDARMNYGAMLSRAGRNDEALAHIREAARIAPENPEPRVYLALIEAQMGRFADAARDAEAAQKINPQQANEFLTSALRMPPKDTNLADFIATMRAR
jgi:protein O-mannosyl-transferase